MSEWSTADVNDLKDSSFLYIAPGGKKDEEGKTTPRDLRHFPVRGPDGKPDAAHVRNALARIPQSNLPDKVKAEASGAARKLLDDLNDGETHKAQWPSDFNTARKMASGKTMPGTLQDAVAKDLEAAWKAGDVSVGQAARAATKEPAETERGKTYGGAVPVRTEKDGAALEDRANRLSEVAQGATRSVGTLTDHVGRTGDENMKVHEDASRAHRDASAAHREAATQYGFGSPMHTHHQVQADAHDQQADGHARLGHSFRMGLVNSP